MIRSSTLLIALGAVLAAASSAPAAPLRLERVVLVQRHGVRPPTSSNADLAKYAAQPWPDWPVAPGELTPHGGQTVKLMGDTLREAYRRQGLLPPNGCPGERQASVWADGADQRTRRTGEILAEALAPGCGIKAGWAPPLPRDPMFGGSTETACRLEPAPARAAVVAAIGPSLATPASRRAMSRLQSILAPDACKGGKGTCFSGDDTLADSPRVPAFRVRSPSAPASPRICCWNTPRACRSPTSAGAARPAWRRSSSIMPVHERLFGMLRRDTYLAGRQGALMARTVLAALDGSAGAPAQGPQYGPAARVVALAGHDTNIAFMGAVFGLDWTLPGQPDVTSPAQTLALELWADPATGERYVRPVMYYETLDQLRTLKPASARRLALRFDDCADGRDGACSLTEASRRVLALIPPGCGEVAVARETLRQ